MLTHQRSLVYTRLIQSVVLALTVLIMGACQSLGGSPAVTLTIVSGSENTTLEPIIQDWAHSHNYNVQTTYLGSLDIARLLQSGSVSYDAV